MLQMAPLASFYAASLWFGCFLDKNSKQPSCAQPANDVSTHWLGPTFKVALCYVFVIRQIVGAAAAASGRACLSSRMKVSAGTRKLGSYLLKKEKWRPVNFPSQISVGMWEVLQNVQNFRESVGFCSGIKWLKTRICPSVPDLKQRHLLA